jgi:hypothetical protein
MEKMPVRGGSQQVKRFSVPDDTWCMNLLRRDDLFMGAVISNLQKKATV